MKKSSIPAAIIFFVIGTIMIAIAVAWWIYILPQQAQSTELTAKGSGMLTQLQQGVSMVIMFSTFGLLGFYAGIRKLITK